MAAEVIMPALGMAQETGKLIAWLKKEGESVQKGEPLMEVETDKAAVEIEAPASGVLSGLIIQPGQDVPVGQVIGWILSPGEQAPETRRPGMQSNAAPATQPASPSGLEVSPVARKVAAEHGVDLAKIKPGGGRVTKEDVLSYLSKAGGGNGREKAARTPASPKARRLAQEHELDIASLPGSGPQGAVLAEDVERAAALQASQSASFQDVLARDESSAENEQSSMQEVSSTWQVMAARMAESWKSAPHFYLVREVRAAALVELHSRLKPIVLKRSGLEPTYTDLLLKIIAVALRDHPRLNASWAGDSIRQNTQINLGLAVGIEEGLVVPVIHEADRLSIAELAARRQELVKRAREHRLRSADLNGGTFTLTNLGMYNVDTFLAVLNPPQAAILAVGRIADRVVPEDGQPVVRPTLGLSLSCDHRAVDGMRAAQFFDELTNLIEEPWGLLA